MEKLGETYGKLLSFVYTEIRGMIVYAFEERKTDITILCELFVQLYTCFADEMPSYELLKDIVYWYVSDYCDVKLEQRVRDMVDPEMSFARDIICEADLNSSRYLYLFGEYVTESEIQTAQFLNTLSQEKIEKLARTFTEGYRKGFEVAGIDLSKKKTVNVRYQLGFERVIKEAVRMFEEMGLDKLPVCVAKTQYSFSDDATKLGAPEGFTVTVRNVKISAGAGFIVVLTGDIMTMPGLPKVPAAEKIDVDENGKITGLF